MTTRTRGSQVFRSASGLATPLASLATDLQTIPNVGPATAGDLRRLGVARPADLIGKDADRLYNRICSIDGVRHDPCLRDVFRAAIDFAEGGAPRPWWTFTPERKAKDAATERSKRRR